MEPITRSMEPGDLVNVFEKRYTCKSYDPDRSVSQADMDALLEVARLSPSSMGLEPWHFLVYERGEKLAEFLPLCWGYHEDPSHVVAILARRHEHFRPGSEYVRHIHEDVQGMPADALEARYQKIDTFLHEHLGFKNDEYGVQGWADRQTYIVLGNLMTAAALFGIDATPIEGLEVEKVQDVMVKQGAFDTNEYHLVCLIAFGYTNRDQHRPKTRRPKAEVVTYIK